MKNLKTIRSAYIKEELYNSISHGLMILISLAGTVPLIVSGFKNESHLALFSAIIYGLSLVFLYISSTLYHSTVKENLKFVFRIMDHAGIYVLIAGTYTPVMLITIGGPIGWTFFFIQWSIAITGIILKIFFTGRYEILSLILYGGMGWMAIFKIDLLYNLLPTSAFWLLVSGGLVYTLGITFYVLEEKLKFAHFIWHLFVITGSILHYLLICIFVL